jgi:SAM-dependent methyltransferase
MEKVIALLRKVPFLVRINHAYYALKKSLELTASNFIYRREISEIKRLGQFAPNTSGYYQGLEKNIHDLTLQSVTQVFPTLASISDRFRHKPLEVITSEQFCLLFEAVEEANALKKVFDSYGCDKAQNHDYHYVYGAVMKNLGKTDSMLEIGLGTTNTDVVSNMGKIWIPGNSLRAFREYLPRTSIYGADIDKRILFQEERIKTYFVDQTDASTIKALIEKIPGKLDLLIDDGLHAPNANMAVLADAFDKIRAGGWLVIEDISPEALPIWRVASAILPSQYTSYLIEAKGGMVFVVQMPR